MILEVSSNMVFCSSILYLLLEKTKIHWNALIALQHDIYVCTSQNSEWAICVMAPLRGISPSSEAGTQAAGWLLWYSCLKSLGYEFIYYRKEGLEELVSMQYTQVNRTGSLSSTVQSVPRRSSRSLRVSCTCVGSESWSFTPRIPSREHFKGFPWNKRRNITYPKKLTSSAVVLAPV